jgi:hypothetical protein
VFRSLLTLSHDLPAPVTILHPAHESELPARNGNIVAVESTFTTED